MLYVKNFEQLKVFRKVQNFLNPHDYDFLYFNNMN